MPECVNVNHFRVASPTNEVIAPIGGGSAKRERRRRTDWNNSLAMRRVGVLLSLTHSRGLSKIHRKFIAPK